MSLTLTLSGKSSVLTANYSPAVDLSDGDYELGLALFETTNAIPNVNSSNNKFYFDEDDTEITIPEGSYEVRDINKFLKRAIVKKRNAPDIIDVIAVRDNNEDDELLTIRANNNTMRCEIWSTFRINFDKSNSIGSLLGF